MVNSSATSRTNRSRSVVVSPDEQHGFGVKYSEIIANNLSKAGWSWGCVSAPNAAQRTTMKRLLTTVRRAPVDLAVLAIRLVWHGRIGRAWSRRKEIRC